MVDEEDVIAAYQEWRTLEEVARLFQITTYRVRKVLVDNKVPRRSKNWKIRKVYPREETRIIEAYKEGVPLAGIYSRFGICKATLYRLLDRGQVPRRRVESGSLLPPHKLQDIRKQLELGESPYSIARDYQTSVSTVFHLRKKWNLPPRKPWLSKAAEEGWRKRRERAATA